MLQEIFTPVKKEIASLNKTYKKVLQSNASEVTYVLSKMTLFEGKRIRAALVFLSAGITGKINKQTHLSAFGFELLHCTSLIHDDVIDNGQKRHDQPTLNAIWNNKIAVLGGDYLLSLCMDFIVQANYTELLLKLSEVAKLMVCGELRQLKQSQRQHRVSSKKSYLKTIHYKTAALMSACCEMGAASSTSDNKIIDQWKTFGEEIGIMFQLKDDLLDYQTDTHSSKDAHKDIKEHKITLPFIVAIQQTPIFEKSKLLELYLHHTGTENEIQDIIHIVTKRGGIRYTKYLINNKAENCINFINQQKDSKYKKSLLLLVQFIRDQEF
ncbi:MAG: polyprenyl synthetase family protein [Bacteroidales bacterium]|jgi:octaprenyl-diphosphate synthase|nr:polyprenyl synthetase family protein [Bacteroidales bacterium]